MAQSNFNSTQQEKYDQILDLDFENILTEFSIHDVYLNGLSSALDALINENPKRLNKNKEQVKDKIDRLENEPNQPEALYYEGQLRWLLAIIELNNGSEFRSLLQLRFANKALVSNKKGFPDFKPNMKLGATLSIIFGSIPESQKWAFDFLGLHGSVIEGVNQLDEYHLQGNNFSQEARLLSGLVHSFLLNNHKRTLETLNSNTSPLILALLLRSHVLLKAGKNEDLIGLASRGANSHPIFEYLLGEAFYRKGMYDQAIAHFTSFVNDHKGISNKKDALYKKGLCYYLKDDFDNASKSFQQSRNNLVRSVSDKYATTQLDKLLSNKFLVQARHFSDGGYYDKAINALSNFDIASELEIDQVEYVYRKASIAMLMNHIPDAIEGFREVINLGQDKEWYFAANSALKLGYIFAEQQNKAMAVRSFELVLSFRNFEYENSIKSAARAGLAQINSYD